MPFGGFHRRNNSFRFVDTLLGTNISPEKSILKMIFLFPRWDMLISWRVNKRHGVTFYKWVVYMACISRLHFVRVISPAVAFFPYILLLMVQKSGQKNTWDVKKSCKKLAKLPTSTIFLPRISEASTVIHPSSFGHATNRSSLC